MKEKKLTPLMCCHLAMMVALGITGIVISALMFSGKDGPDADRYRYLLASVHVVNALSFVFGILYLWNGYKKNAAAYYKVFLIGGALSGILIILAISPGPGTTPAIIMSSARICILLILALVKDLGKRNTWIVFCILIALDLVMSFFFNDARNAVPSVVINALVRLFTDGTIGLAIRGKYADKDTRGTT